MVSRLEKISDVKGWGIGVLAVGYGLLILGAAHQFGLTDRALLNLPIMGVVALCGLGDFQRSIIPDWLTIPALVWALAISALLGRPGVMDALLGILVCAGILFVLALLSRGSIGGGDVKLMAVIGAALGWQWGFAVLCFSQVAAAIVAICLLLIRRKERKDELPFGPFLATFALLALWARPI